MKMDMDSAAVFLAGSILYAVGIIVILICIVVCNNIIHKYWKSFGWGFIPNWMNEIPPKFADEEDLNRITPTLDEKAKK